MVTVAGQDRHEIGTTGAAAAGRCRRPRHCDEVVHAGFLGIVERELADDGGDHDLVRLDVDLIEQAFDDFEGGGRALGDDGVGDVVGDEQGAADEHGFRCGADGGIAEGAAAAAAAAATEATGAGLSHRSRS